MRTLSGVVAVAASGALVVGSIGMASAQSHSQDHAQNHAQPDDDHADRSHSRHVRPGHVGENPTLAPKGTKPLKKLVGIVNSDRDIEISDRTPRHGRYKIVVRDSAKAHNWHLYGKGISISTPVRKTGRWVFTVRLKKGEYRVVCDPHYDDMEFDLIVH